LEASNTDHKIVHQRDGRTEVVGIEPVPVSSPADLQKLLERARKNRSVGKTKLNDRSSRSHSVFQLVIDGQNSVSGHKTRGVLNLIDLAGSERYLSNPLSLLCSV
jgi:kinesin family protein C1